MNSWPWFAEEGFDFDVANQHDGIGAAEPMEARRRCRSQAK
jgi:hypothetical protein